jgi:predicted esterase YcpF (UPF0227 family)
LAAAVHSFITSDPDLHQKVLLYEPIWIEQLHANLKANNLKFKMNELMDYLDEQVREQIPHYIGIEVLMAVVMTSFFSSET